MDLVTTQNSHLPICSPAAGEGGGVAANRRPRNHKQVLTTRVGLQFPPGLTFEQWVDAGPKLLRLVDTFAWCMGDWLVYGREKYEGKYLEAIEKVGLDYQTLRNYAWVARKFHTSRRREGLSFQHHAEVASAPPARQDTWLDRAQEHGWSKNQLRQQMRKERRAEQSDGIPAPVPPRFHVEKDRLATWRFAATRAGTDLASWIVATLDREATRAVGAEAAE